MASCIHLARLGNRYLAETEPWKLLKSDPLLAMKVLRTAAELCAELVIALKLFLPFTAQRLQQQLAWEPSPQQSVAWWKSGIRQEVLEDNHRLAQASLLFTPIEDQQVEECLERLRKMAKSSQD